jgi:hypothetical protein
LDEKVLSSAKRRLTITSQANAHVRFRRALQSGSLTLAMGAAAELGGHLDLEDALGLTLLLAGHEPSRFSRAAARWIGRYCVEQPRVELAAAQLLLSLLAALPVQPTAAARGLEALFMERGEHALVEVMRRWQVETAKR